MKETNILITSVGRRSYMVEYFKQALAGNGKVHVSNSSSISPAFAVADASVVSPLIYEEEYIPFLLDYCKNNHIRAVLSLFDADLPILSANQKAFSQIGVELLVSSEDVLHITNDKWETFRFLKRNGIATPRTFISLSEVLHEIQLGKLEYPVMVKPRWGCGSISVFEAENEEELRIFFEKTKRNVRKTYLKYESSQDNDNCVIIQEKLLGQEYGLDVVNDLNGCYCNTIVRMKYAMRSGETDCAKIIDSASFRTVGEKLSNALHHIGNLDVDAFQSTDGSIVILEMNARFGGGYPFSHTAGANLPKQMIQWLNSEATDMTLLNASPNILMQKDLRIVKIES